MKEVQYELFKKYFNGETDASENRRLIEWLLEDKENEKVFADTLSVISAADVVCDERFEARREAFLERLSRNIDKQDEAQEQKLRVRWRLGRSRGRSGFVPFHTREGVLIPYSYDIHVVLQHKQRF